MTTTALGRVVVSINRALWGEVSCTLRSVQFKVGKAQIRLRFVFEGTPDDADRDSVASVGAEVAADFPKLSVTEEIVATRGENEVPYEAGWHAAFARREASLAR